MIARNTCFSWQWLVFLLKRIFFLQLKKINYICTPIWENSSLKTLTGHVVQLVRMPACHAGGREFESRRDR